MIDAVRYSKSEFTIKSIKVYQPSLLLTKECEILLCSDDSDVSIPSHSITFLEKGLIFNARISRKENGIPYIVNTISNKDMMNLAKVFDMAGDFSSPPLIPKRRTLKDKVFNFGADSFDEMLFDKISYMESGDMRLTSKLLYLLSKIQKKDELRVSLVVSSSRNFSDKIRELVECKLDKKWKLSDIADYFFCSEITIRKKLEKENTSFNKLLLDIRMKHAASFILDSDCNVTMTSKSIGINSTSYFIKLFKSYYGMTPKKYYLNLKM
ncbi:AraC family transcriptional regulator [Escherichia albertii]|uniref:AraC family transcriptional regulator n=1 Tax=Escherichia albertii TaxID=208962 RepID=UPI0032B7E186